MTKIAICKENKIHNSNQNNQSEPNWKLYKCAYGRTTSHIYSVRPYNVDNLYIIFNYQLMKINANNTTVNKFHVGFWTNKIYPYDNIYQFSTGIYNMDHTCSFIYNFDIYDFQFQFQFQPFIF